MQQTHCYLFSVSGRRSSILTTRIESPLYRAKFTPCVQLLTDGRVCVANAAATGKRHWKRAALWQLHRCSVALFDTAAVYIATLALQPGAWWKLCLACLIYHAPDHPPCRIKYVLRHDSLGWCCCQQVFTEQLIKFTGTDIIPGGVSLGQHLSFDSWSEVSQICGDSRVWGGMHFEVTTRHCMICYSSGWGFRLSSRVFGLGLTFCTCSLSSCELFYALRIKLHCACSCVKTARRCFCLFLLFSFLGVSSPPCTRKLSAFRKPLLLFFRVPKFWFPFYATIICLGQCHINLPCSN